MSNRILFLAFVVLGALPVSALAQSSGYPDGWIIWSSNREDSRVEAYMARADGTQIKRITHEGAGLPSWAPDGRWISYMDASSTLVYLMRPDGSDNHLLTVGWQIQWLWDNSGLLVADDAGYNVYDPETGEKTLLFSPADYPQFQGTTFHVGGVTQDNRYVLTGSHLYINGYTGANGTMTSEYSAIVLDLLHKDKLYFLGSGCWPFTPPQGDLVFHICADCPKHPDIYRMHLADLATRASYAAEVAHDDADWGHEYNPHVSNDNRWLAYMASTGCHAGEGCDYDIWLHELGTDPSQRLRVTQNAAFDGYPQLFVGPLWQASAAPRVLVTPNRVTFFASAGGPAQAKVLKLKNTGGGELPASTVTLDPAVPWLDIAQDAKGITVGLPSGAAITRGTHCTNLTITTPGALGSPVTVPITVVADETFPHAEAGISWDAVPVSRVDGGTATDAPMSIDTTAAEAAGVINMGADAAGFDCDALAGLTPADAGVDVGTVADKPATGGGGCSCEMAGPSGSAGPLAFVLAGLAALAHGLRRRRAPAR